MSPTATRPSAPPTIDPSINYRPGPLGWLGVAVLLDAFLVRLILLPVLLRLTGRAAWWTPSWLTRILPNIRFSHS